MNDEEKKVDWEDELPELWVCAVVDQFEHADDNY